MSEKAEQWFSSFDFKQLLHGDTEGVGFDEKEFFRLMQSYADQEVEAFKKKLITSINLALKEHSLNEFDVERIIKKTKP